MRPPTKMSGGGSSSTPRMPLSVGRSEMQALLTSRGTSNFEDAIISSQFGLLSVLTRISNQQEEAMRAINRIARKVGTLESSVNLLHAKLADVTARQLQNDSLNFANPPMDWEEFVNSLMKSPERTTSQDITCEETFLNQNPQSIEKPSRSNGFGEDQEWVKVD